MLVTHCQSLRAHRLQKRGPEVSVRKQQRFDLTQGAAAGERYAAEQMAVLDSERRA